MLYGRVIGICGVDIEEGIKEVLEKKYYEVVGVGVKDMYYKCEERTYVGVVLGGVCIGMYVGGLLGYVLCLCCLRGSILLIVQLLCVMTIFGLVCCAIWSI